jgi:hypothetical protein
MEYHENGDIILTLDLSYIPRTTLQIINSFLPYGWVIKKCRRGTKEVEDMIISDEFTEDCEPRQLYGLYQPVHPDDRVPGGCKYEISDWFLRNENIAFKISPTNLNYIPKWKIDFTPTNTNGSSGQQQANHANHRSDGDNGAGDVINLE